MNDEQIKHMVNQFLKWKLPEDFQPDNGISFQPTYNSLNGPRKNEPSGTNLLDANQAEVMIRNLIENLPPAEQ